MLDQVRPVPIVEAAALEADIHGTFAAYRATHPLIALAGGGYVVLRYADVERLMSDPRLQATETALPHQAGLTKGALFDLFEHGMLTANRETHARRRAAVSCALARESLERFRQHVRDAASHLIDAYLDDGRLELVSGYARRLPVLALARLLDLADDALPAFERDVLTMNAFFRPGPTPAAVDAAEEAASRLQNALGDRLDQVDVERSGSFFSTYKTIAGENQLSPLEALMQIVSVVLGGSDTTRAAIVVMVGLLAERGLWQEVRRQPALIGAVVSESLRCEPAVGSVPRLTVEEIELDGTVVPAGRPVLLSTMSALRDPDVFPNPDTFDLTRPPLRWHPVFGGGEHRCLGEALAKIEMEEALSVLLASLPDPRIDGQGLTIHGHAGVRKVDELTLRWH